jgi:hypothetical protein
MNYEIRAMSFSEILDTGFRLVRDHFALLAGIGLVLYGPFAIMLELIGSGRPEEMGLGTALAALGLALLIVALSPIAQGAMTLAIGDAYRGQSMTIGAAYRASLGRVLALTGTFLLMGLGIVVGLLLLVIPGIYLALAWMLAMQIVMLEGIAGSSALSRSRQLLRDHMMRALGIFIVAAIVGGVISTVLQLLLSGIPIVRAVANAIAQSVTMAFYTGVGVVLYFDLRCRKENFDLEHLAQLVESAGAPAPPTTHFR